MPGWLRVACFVLVVAGIVWTAWFFGIIGTYRFESATNLPVKHHMVFDSYAGRVCMFEVSVYGQTYIYHQNYAQSALYQTCLKLKDGATIPVQKVFSDCHNKPAKNFRYSWVVDGKNFEPLILKP